MIHFHRLFSVGTVETIDELTEKLTEHIWTLCTCFEYGGLLLANDSFSEDGAQEYAVYKDGTQIESLTVSWMTRDQLKDAIEGLRTGETEPFDFRSAHPLKTEPSAGHRCALCH